MFAFRFAICPICFRSQQARASSSSIRVPDLYRLSTVCPASLSGMNRQGAASLRNWGGTNFIREQSLHGCGRVESSKLIQVGESSKTKEGRHGARADRQ